MSNEKIVSGIQFPGDNSIYKFDTSNTAYQKNNNLYSDQKCTKLVQLNIKTEQISDNGGLNLNTIISNVKAQLKLYQNITVNTFEKTNEYEEYPYRGTISNSNINSSCFPIVTFSLKNAENFAPIAVSFNGGIYIYARENPNSITVPTICIIKGD